MRQHLLAIVAFCFPLLVYVLGLAPDVVIEGDSGEFIAGIAGFGIFHSPGFPGYVVLAKLFTSLLPFIDIARAVNLFSALGGAVASLLIFLLWRNLGLSWRALIPAWTLAFANEFWVAASSAEIYTWALAFLLLPVVLLYSLTQKNIRTHSFWLGAALVWGIAVHVYVWAFAPIFLFFAWRYLRKLGVRRLPNTLWMGAGIGLLPYVYIPLRARKYFWINEGDIHSLQSFLSHVTWILQRERVAQHSLHNGTAWMQAKGQQLAYYCHEMLTQWSVLGLLVLAGCGVALWPKVLAKANWRQRDVALLSAAAGVGLFSVVWLVFSADTFSFSDAGENSVHLLVLYCFASVLVGLAVAQLGDRPAFAVLLCLCIFVGARLRAHDLSQDDIAVAHGRDLLTHLAPGALFLADSDNDLMPTVYLAAVRGVRPDIAIVNMTNGSQGYYNNLRRLFPQLAWGPYSETFVVDLVRNHLQRPIYFSNAYGAMLFLQQTGMARDYAAIPLDGAFRLVRRTEDWRARVLAELTQAFELSPREYPFALRGREADVIVQRSAYYLELRNYFAQQGMTEAAQTATRMGLAYPQLNQTEFGAAVRAEFVHR